MTKRIDEAKAEISVSGTLAKYNYRAGDASMNKCMDYRSSYMSKLYKARNLEVTMNEKRQAALIMYESTSVSTRLFFSNVNRSICCSSLNNSGANKNLTVDAIKTWLIWMLELKASLKKL